MLEPGQTVDADIYWTPGPNEPNVNEKISDDCQKKRSHSVTRQCRTALCKAGTGKCNELRWEVLYRSLYISDQAPSDYHLFRSMQNFLRDKNLKIWRRYKLLCPDISLKIHNILNDSILKICSLDGERLLVTMVTTLFVKIKVLIKTYSDIQMKSTSKKRHYLLGNPICNFHSTLKPRLVVFRKCLSL